MKKSFLIYIESLKLSRFGFKSESGFYYHKKTKDLHWNKDLFLGMNNFENIYLPAYTDADLNEILPYKVYMNRSNINGDKYELRIHKTKNNKWVCEYQNQIINSPSLCQVQGNTEVEAKARMICFLLKKKLIEL